jgi:hypothetical protein
MLATQLNALVTSNAIQRNGVVRLNKYLCNIVSNRRIVIVLGLDVVAADVGYVIGRHSRLGSPSGNPAVLKDDGAVEEAPAVAPVPAPAAAYGAPAPSYPAESVTEFGAPAPYAPVPAAYAAPTYGASVHLCALTLSCCRSLGESVLRLTCPPFHHRPARRVGESVPAHQQPQPVQQSLAHPRARHVSGEVHRDRPDARRPSSHTPTPEVRGSSFQSILLTKPVC